MDPAVIEAVRERAEWRCEYCKMPQSFSGLRFHVEHIRARQHRGTDNEHNLALACPECNLRKGPNLSSIDPETERLAVLFNPRLQHWSDHFTWSCSHIHGTSPEGRATVELLQLNRADRVRIRELMSLVGIT